MFAALANNNDNDPH
ncbi:Putative Aspartate--tRNA ligase gene leader peptide [Deinococcus deserti]|uniref:Putative Aspartate--tRNA ligase gene leader peptide n=1 Tax=Deinococcus deserti (strain DSM 17065 / CIP 109153 / LMG 22923 / VCD115) TaxID=546414 RepID=X5H5F2_DEIDV|nr:Putative Aspartate--tRNA ligase gene leader peptide [Deinococcus deserti VCD115]